MPNDRCERSDCDERGWLLMYIAHTLTIGFEMPNEYDVMEKFKSENEGFTETVTTSNYIMFQKTSRMVSSLPIKGGDE